MPFLDVDVSRLPTGGYEPAPSSMNSIVILAHNESISIDRYLASVARVGRSRHAAERIDDMNMIEQQLRGSGDKN